MDKRKGWSAMKKDENWNKKQVLTGAGVSLAGILLMFVSRFFGGTNVEDFISGTLLGISCGVMLVGIYVIARTFRKKK